MAEVSIIVGETGDIGWMPAVSRDREIFPKQIYLDAPSRNRGLGTRILERLLRDARQRGLAVALDVVKENPAPRLYDAWASADR